MASLHRLVSGLLLASCACFGSPAEAQAFYLGGTFSGIAHAQELPLNFPPPLPVSYYDGAPVTGTFQIEVPDPQFQVGGDGYAYFLNGNGGSLSLSYTIKGIQFDFHSALPYDSNGPSVILLSAGSPLQTVSFLTDFQPVYQGAEFELTGPDGSLFTGLDAGTLHFDAAAPPTFTTSFASSAAEISVVVSVEQVSFQTTAPIPEPGTRALALAGCACWVWRSFWRSSRAMARELARS